MLVSACGHEPLDMMIDMIVQHALFPSDTYAASTTNLVHVHLNGCCYTSSSTQCVFAVVAAVVCFVRMRNCE